mgnify:FL=1
MNKTGFEASFKEKYSQAYFLALRILHDDEASKDVVADAFELVWRRTQQEKIENISAYLMMSVRNVCLDYIRKLNVRSHYVQASVQATEQTIHNPDYWDVREDKIQAIMGSLDELTPRTRQILKLCYVERKKYREVAVELQISESAVKKHIMQALSYMRQKFRTHKFY